MSFHRGPQITKDSLVLYLDAANPKSYPGTGTTWNDLIGNGNDGTLINGSQFDSENNGVIKTDGVDDSVSIINPQLTFDSQLTLETWVKVDHTGNYGGLFTQNGLGGFGLSIRGSDGFIIHYIGNSSSTVGGWWVISSFNNLMKGPSNWHHICSVADMSISGSTNRWFYIDGVERATRIQPFTSTQIPFSSNDLTVINSSFEGGIGMSKIYNKALTPEEVLQNYNATKSRFNI